MIQIEKLNAQESQKVQTACALLFSAKTTHEPSFYQDLTLEKIKLSYRSKTKLYHPDKNLGEPEAVARVRIERFIKIQEAYQYLTSFAKPVTTKQVFERRDPFQERRPPGSERRNRAPYSEASSSEKISRPAKIVAIGGAKGGIGKSIFAANLAVYLSSQKKKTVAIDLDLGGANLHLYLGETFLKHNLNDYFDRSIPNLEDIMMQTKFGPGLIGGDSGRLGAANLHFAKKLKLMSSLRKLNTDYIIVDLGGDTTHNIMDFFLMADYQFVMTSSEPASYLDAYTFLKIAIFRKLSRIFGAESPFHSKKNPELEELIKMTLNPSGEIKSFHSLIELVKDTQPHNLDILQQTISSFAPYLIVNRVSYEPDVNDFVARIQSVLWKTTATRINFIGTLPRADDVESSARLLVPIMSQKASSPFSKALKQIASKVFL
nr:P-loop NTPase [Desulfobulbaceae bacterium]